MIEAEKVSPPGLIAITGATGFVGSHIALHLLEAGYQVRSVARNPAKGAFLEEHGATSIRADLTEPERLEEAFQGAQAVVANAALGSFQGDIERSLLINEQGTIHVCRAAHAAGVSRIILISTVAVYLTRLNTMLSEETAEYYGEEKRSFNWSDRTTDWRYALSKSRGEARAWELAEELDLQVTALRPGPVYGSRDPKLTARYLATMEKPFALAPTVGVPHVHAGDIAHAAEQALLRPASSGRAYNITGPPSSPYQMLSALKKLRGSGPLLLPIPLPIWVAYDTTRAAEELGFRNRSIEDGLREVLSRREDQSPK